MVMAVVVVMAVLAIAGALEVSRRAAAGRRMEEFYDAMRPVEQDPAPTVRPARRARAATRGARGRSPGRDPGPASVLTLHPIRPRGGRSGGGRSGGRATAGGRLAATT